jgi:hypothetical protein
MGYGSSVKSGKFDKMLSRNKMDRASLSSKPQKKKGPPPKSGKGKPPMPC